MNTKKYGDTHPRQQKYQYNLVMLMAKSFVPLSLFHGDPFRALLSDLYTSINQVSRALVLRKLIPDKSESLELQVKDHLNKCGSLVLTYNLWMSRKNEEIFSMNTHRFEGF